MPAFEYPQTVDLYNPKVMPIIQIQGHVGDALAQAWVITIQRNRLAVDLSGYTGETLVRREGGGTVHVPISIASNVITVTFPAEAMAVAGTHAGLLRLTNVSHGFEQIAVECQLNVAPSETDPTIVPGTDVTETLSGLLASEADRKAAEAVRAQFYNGFSSQLTENAARFAPASEQMYNAALGYNANTRINATTGALYASAPAGGYQFHCTKFQAVSAEKTVYFYYPSAGLATFGSAACYDASGAYLGSVAFSNYGYSDNADNRYLRLFTTLANTSTVVICLRGADTVSAGDVTTTFAGMGLFYSTDPYDYTYYYGNNSSKLRYDNGLSNPWVGQWWSSYGNSITAQGNGNNRSAGYQKYVSRRFGFAKHFGRGIGGQKFTWNTDTWYANGDGTYNTRPPAAQPGGTTEHKGAYCSWDRIKTMYPDNIRNLIRLIVILGGTNDITSIVSLDSVVWVPGSTVDPDWTAAAENTLGGDYNITTFSGAVASTIMKLQARCPNAVIMLATPLSGRQASAGASSPMPWSNGTQTTEVVVGLIKAVGQMFSTPVSDVYGTCGINMLNSATYLTDGVHPNEAGKMRLADAMIADIMRITPMA